MAQKQPQVDELVERVLGMSPADETEVSLDQREMLVTRFAGSSIHQPIYEDGCQVRVRVLKDGRMGSAGTNQLDESSLHDTLHRAIEMSSLAPAEEDPTGFCGPDELYQGGSCERTGAPMDPREGAAAVSGIAEMAHVQGQQVSGTYQAERHFLCVGTSSAGVAAASHTCAFLKILSLDHDTGTSGWASCMSEAPDALPVSDTAAAAVERASWRQGTGGMPSGPVRAIFGPDAVAEIATFLALSCFTPGPYHSGGALTSGRMGEKLFDPIITLWNDAQDPRTCRTAFDYDGVACRKVSLIEEGVVSGVVYDRETAHRFGACSTGNAQPRPSVFLTGPQSNHLFLASGAQSRDALLDEVQEGVFITRFQYTSLVDPTDLTISGSTRDGTFLVRDGRIGEALPNLSFRSSIVSLLNNLIGLGREGLLVPGDLGAVWVPLLAADNFVII